MLFRSEIFFQLGKDRESKDGIILYALGEQTVYDLAWAYKIYQNALEKGT